MTSKQKFRQNNAIDAHSTSFNVVARNQFLVYHTFQASQNDLDIELNRRLLYANKGFIIHPENLTSVGELSNLESPLGEVTAGVARPYPVTDIPSDADDCSDNDDCLDNAFDDVCLVSHIPAICPPVNSMHPLCHDVALDVQPSATSGSTDLYLTSMARNNQVDRRNGPDDHHIIFSYSIPHAFPYFLLPAHYSSKAHPVLKNVNANSSALQDLEKPWENFLKFLSDDWKSLGALSLVLITCIVQIYCHALFPTTACKDSLSPLVQQVRIWSQLCVVFWL